LVVFAGVYEHAAPALHQAPSVKNVIVVGPEPAPQGTTPWPTLVAGTAPTRSPATVRPDDLAVICYTSGTTGRSKGAMLTHRNLIANCAQVDASERLKGILPADVVVLVLPLFHIYALNVGLTMALRAGATLVLVARFEPAAVLEAIQRQRCTIFLGAPPMYVAWVNMADLSSYDLSSLRATFSGAAPLPAAVLERFAAATGVEIVEGYGLTETAPVVTSNAAGPRCKPGTVGPAIPGVTVRLVDEDDRDVPVGAAGELICRGENVMAGYWRQPEATAEALRGGWFHTGDIATIDADGYYTIVDRKKDMINAGGFKVWPREVEEVLYAHPAVRDAAVVAMPDPYAGERPLAVIALKDGQSVTAEDLMAYCQSRLASFKAPARVEFRADLPKLPTGKVLRRALRDEIWQRRPAAAT
jgi:long-chain acyl-CoA synthetase